MQSVLALTSTDFVFLRLDYSTVESRGNIWWHSAGDDITENYLQQNKRDSKYCPNPNTK